MDSLNKWLTLIANIGVIAGVIFVGFEIQQNTEMMRAQTRDSIAEKQLMWTDWAANEYGARILAEAMGDGSPNDWSRAFLMSAMLRIWENEHYQYSLGLFDESEFQPRRELWKFNIRNMGIARWEEIRRWYSPAFRSVIDQIQEEIRNDEAQEQIH